MSLTIKAYILSGRSKTDSVEIRRFNVSDNTVRNYYQLEDKVYEVFPSLNRTGINLHWKDNDGDLIHFTSDEELAEALRTAVDGVLKVFIQEKSKSQGELHPGVICNKCGKQVRGNRYKCLICQEYELCEDCENLRVHLEHAVIRIPSPSTLWMPLVTVSSNPVSPAVKNKSVDFNQSTRCNATPFDIHEYQPPLQSRPGFAAAMCDPFMHDWSLLSDSAHASSLSPGSGVSRIIDSITHDEDIPRSGGTHQLPKKPMSRSLFDFDDDDDDVGELPKESTPEAKPNKPEGKPLESIGPKDKKLDEKPLPIAKPKPKQAVTVELPSSISGNSTLGSHSPPKSSQVITEAKPSPSATSMDFPESLESSYSQPQHASKYADSLNKSREESHSAAAVSNIGGAEADVSLDSLTLTNQATAITQEDPEKTDATTNDSSEDTPLSNSNGNTTADTTTNNNSTEEGEVASREENRNNEITSNNSEDNETTTETTAEQRRNGSSPTVDYNLYYPKIRRYAEALDNLLSMGFTNEGGWLSLLVEEKRGDIIRVLDFIENNIQKCKENEQAKTRR
ncbi:uncharacterized SDCCAG3 family protein-like [Octopus vulgaris]|uniref:Uncharacterized SDCCAG3 family protein-like n=1 Tax=Octopus vulgaris TaxID=6645 RepID=A0AA36EWF1_OCTVU|nr:uncharacterized SDCCAG3 family protein-like [Octopus vulgaris]